MGLGTLFDKQTRLRLVLFGVVTFFIEAVVKLVFPEFVFMELVGAQGGLILGYIGGRSYQKKWDCQENNFDEGTRKRGDLA